MERRPDTEPAVAAAAVVRVALPERLRQVRPGKEHLSQEHRRHQQQDEVRHRPLEERS